MHAAFSWNGSQNINMYFTKKWNQEECSLVGYATEFSAFERDGYKRCVCKGNLGIDSPNC